MKPDITISIVNTNNRDITLNCLESVFSTQGDLRLEVIVVNNGCTDGSSAAIRNAFPFVRVYENEKKLGFSTNNNMAFDHASGRYLMLLNDDTIVLPDALKTMVAFMDSHPDAGIVGPCLLNSDRSLQPSYDYFPTPFREAFLPLSEHLFRRPITNEYPVEVDTVGGACLMARTKAVEAVGMLDTQFDPIYSEEIDWCYRFKKAGWKIYYLPVPKIIHFGGLTMLHTPFRRLELINEKKALFFRKHYGKFDEYGFRIMLLVSNTLKAMHWQLLKIFGNKHARDEVLTHVKLAVRAISNIQR
jgi:GT2 family glycosyltransferase